MLPDYWGTASLGPQAWFLLPSAVSVKETAQQILANGSMSIKGSLHSIKFAGLANGSTVNESCTRSVRVWFFLAACAAVNGK